MIEQHKSLSEKFLKKGFWLYFFSFIIAPMGYFIKIIILNELSIDEVGILYGIISLITIISAYNNFGMTQSVQYFIPKFISENRYDKVKSILTYSLILQIITGFIILLIFFFGANYIAENYFQNSLAKSVIQIFAFFFIGTNILNILANFFLSIQNTFFSKLTELIRVIFLFVFILILSLLDISSIEILPYGWIISIYIAVAIGTYIFYKKYYKKYIKNKKILWSKKLFKEILKYSLISFMGAQGATVLSQIDTQMIIFLLGTTDAGYYTIYLTLISMAFVVLIPILGMLMPIFSELNSKKDYDKIKNIKTFFNKYFIIVGFLLSVIFFIYNKEIAYIFFGEKYIMSGEILKYSIFFLIFNILLQINFHLLGGIGKIKERTKIIYYAIILNIITNYILIKNIGVEGAALATGIGWLFIWTLSELKIDKKYKGKTDYTFVFKNIIIFSALGLFINEYLNFQYENFGKIELFGIIALIGTALFSIFLILNAKDTKQLISNIKNR